MKISRIDADYRPSFNEMFFLDTNVWLYLYYPQDSSIAKRLIDRYSAFLAKIGAGSIQTNLVQMSELINTILRAEYRIYTEQGNGSSFKAYRDTDDGKAAMLKAKAICTSILKLADLRDGSFSPDELKAMVLKCDLADFNAVFFAHYCKKSKTTLVTHDFDFAAIDMDIPVLSANSRYFPH